MQDAQEAATEAANVQAVPPPPPPAEQGANPPAKGECLIYGITGSMNCMGSVLLVTAGGCGKLETCMPYQDTAKPEFLAINPFHRVPALKDGDYCLAESNAILRYVATSYVPDAYPTDPRLRGFINWAMDRFSSTMYADCRGTLNPILGYGLPPADQAAVGKKCSQNLEEFAKVFLKGKFVGGQKPSIADYKVAPFFLCYEHPVVRARSCVECPDRIKQFNKDFAAACDTTGMLSSIVKGMFDLVQRGEEDIDCSEATPGQQEAVKSLFPLPGREHMS